MEVELGDIIHLYCRYEIVPSPWFRFDTELARTLRVYKCVVSIPLWGSASVYDRKSGQNLIREKLGTEECVSYDGAGQTQQKLGS